MKNKIKISACYIVKNESANLEKSLQSLCSEVDEIVVVDTGSTDETLNVAKKFGAKIFSETWQNNFSEPRNTALKNSSGKWIIFLDADEFFTDDTAKNIRPAVERADEFKKQAILVNLVNVDVDNENKILGAVHVLRIFKNLPKLHYVGKIHEELRIGDKTFSEIAVAPPNILTLIHTGYSENISKSKAERNLNLLLEELKTDEPQRVYGYLAEAYSGLGDISNAEKFARLDIESGRKKTTFAGKSYKILLGILSDDAKRFDEREKISLKAVEDFPELPEFTAELAECFAAKGEFKKAVELMKEAVEKFKNYRGLEPTNFSPEVVKFVERRIKFWLERI